MRCTAWWLCVRIYSYILPRSWEYNIVHIPVVYHIIMIVGFTARTFVVTIYNFKTVRKFDC
jgi:hypothetical protein